MRRKLGKWGKILAAALIISFVPIPSVDSAALVQTGVQNAYASSVASETALQQHRYCRTKLSNRSQRYIYDRYLSAIKRGKSRCYFDIKKYDMRENNYLVAEYALKMDYPELMYWRDYEAVYWIEDTGRYEEVCKTEIYYNKKFRQQRKEYRKKADAIVASIPEDCVTDYEKARYLYNYLCNNTAYVDQDTDENSWHDDQQTSYGTIIKGESVCEGYARAYQDLLRRAGIRALTVYGYALMDENEAFDQINSYLKYRGRNWAGHAWNVLWLDGKCYYADPTYDDGEDGTVYYDYFCKSRADFDKDHYVRESEKPNRAITGFVNKLLGKCGHESIGGEWEKQKVYI